MELRCPIKDGKTGILGQFMLICSLLWCLCCCSMFLPYLWCFMWWGLWDNFALNFHFIAWFKMGGRIDVALLLLGFMFVFGLVIRSWYTLFILIKIFWINFILSKFLLHPTTIQSLSFVNMVVHFLCLIVWLLLPTDM